VYRVYRVKPSDRARIDAALDGRKSTAADLVSRQSVTVRDAKTLGLPGDALLVLIEGEEAAVKASEGLFAFGERLDGADAEAARRAFQAHEESLASGVGLIFGD
jgi:hypothetical protein